MRICFVGHYSEQNPEGDIGTKTVARNLADVISGKHEILKIDIKDLRSWKQARDFEPDIIHFILAPTAWGFIAGKCFSLFSRGKKVVMSAPNPTLSRRWLVSHLGPDVILTQSTESKKVFRDMGLKTIYLPNGVDTDRFVPCLPGRKEELRDKYHIDREKFVILHVGPVIRKRNLEHLIKLQHEDMQVIIAGRYPCDQRVLNKLRKNQIVVIMEHIEKIEEIYALSDFYIFPTHPGNRGASIEIPLSVLEAMSCNLPVISNKFGGLPGMFKEGDGFTFNNNGNFLENLRNSRNFIPGTREKVLEYSWKNIGKRLENIYFELLESGGRSMREE